MSRKPIRIKIRKEDLLPKERAPILPSKKIESKLRRAEQRPKHKKDLRKSDGE
jgi:hypothetical protein